MILAQLTDLQMRLTKQDETISALKTEVERLSGRPISYTKQNSHTGHSLKTAVPLQYKPHSCDNTHTIDTRQNNNVKNNRPQIVKPHTNITDKVSYNLSDIIKKNEEITIKVGTGKDEEGNFLSTYAYANFDGNDLIVTQCELVPSLIGLKTSKPGEILYKFMEELKNSGHIKRTFSVGPWKLCFVQREGKLISLEELRNTV